MISFKKAGLGIALAATALTAAAPAEAQRWGGYRHYDRGGGNVAGAAVLGGLLGLGVGAAIASGNRDRYYDRGGYYYDAPPPPPPRAYYYDRYQDYAPRCYSQWRWDPYYRQNVRVQVCD